MNDQYQESVERRQYLQSIIDEGGTAFDADTGTLMLNDETSEWMEFAKEHEADTNALILVDIGIDEVSRLFLDWKNLRDLVIIATDKYTTINIEPTGLYNFTDLETLDIRVPETVSITGTSQDLRISPNKFKLFELSAPRDQVHIEYLPHGLELLDLSTTSGTQHFEYQTRTRGQGRGRRSTSIYHPHYDKLRDLHTLKLSGVTKRDTDQIPKVATGLIEVEFM